MNRTGSCRTGGGGNGVECVRLHERSWIIHDDSMMEGRLPPLVRGAPGVPLSNSRSRISPFTHLPERAVTWSQSPHTSRGSVQAAHAIGVPCQEQK